MSKSRSLPLLTLIASVMAVVLVASGNGIFSSGSAFASGSVTITAPASAVATTDSSFTSICSSSCDLSGFDVSDEVLVVVSKSDGSDLSGRVRLTSDTGLDDVTGYATDPTNSGGYAEIAFIGTQAEVNAALETLQYEGPAGGGDETIGISGSLSGAAYFSGTGHYYKFVNSSVSWTAAKAAAGSDSFNGLTGYLANVTSAEENAFIVEKTGGSSSWVGATDEYSQINAATGLTTFANQSAAEGHWYWVTGPEAGTEFWDEAGNTSASADGRIAGKFQYWNNAINQGGWGAEPNNSGSSEHYLQLLVGGTGNWNDLPNTSTLPYVIEYGGAGGTALKQASTTINVETPAPSFALSYNANTTQHQSGALAVGSSLPSNASVEGGTNFTAGSAVSRAGFTFAGWDTQADGGGTRYAAGASVPMPTSNMTLYAQWTIPKAARLFGLTGADAPTVATVTDGGAQKAGYTRGITTNGSSVFFLPSVSGGGTVVRETTLTGTWFADHEVTGTTTALNLLRTASDLAPSPPRDLTYSSGCIFLRENGSRNSDLYCIDTTTWSMTQVSVPLEAPPGSSTPMGLLAGTVWLTGNLIDFPDGRIGAVSAPNWELASGITMTRGTGDGECPTSFYCKILRLYTVSGSGTGVALAHDEDIVIADEDSGWPGDDHGIATDGTYLYQSRHSQGYKVYGLQSGAPSYIVFDGNGSGTCGADAGTSGTLCAINFGTVANATYFSRNHATDQYLMGDFGSGASAPQFVYTIASAPPAGPGSVASVPTAPRSVTATSGDRQVALSWLVPSDTGGGSIVSYTVTASPGGATCTVVATTCTLTGLTNGTSYTFAITAKNNAGDSTPLTSGAVVPGVVSSGGSSGGSSDGGTGSTPVVTPATNPPVVAPARVIVPPQPTPQPRILTGPVRSPGRNFDPSVGTRATVGGAPATVTSTPLTNRGVLVRTGSVVLGFNPDNGAGGGGSQNPSANSSDLTVASGKSTTVSGGGLLPGSQMQVWLPGTNGLVPKELARIPVKSDGTFDSQVSFTSRQSETPIPIGPQVMQVTGYDAQGNQTVVDMTINIAQGSPEPEPNRLVDALPELGPGQSLATSAGVPEIVTIEARPEVREVAVTSGEWSFSVSLPDDAGRVEQVAAGANITLTQSRSAAVSGEGFQPDTRVDVWLFSTPTLLGSMIVSADGSFSGEVYLDSRFAILGEHTLQLQGVAEDGFVKAANLGVVVQESVVLASDGAATVMIWGAVSLVAAAVAFAVALWMVRRRRWATQFGYTGPLPVVR